MRSKTCCFTGHRHIPKGELPELKDKLRGAILDMMNQRVRYFGTGGALGFDTLAAQVVLELRQSHPQLRLCLVLPCRDQANRWGMEDRAHYDAIREQADQVVYVAERYGPGGVTGIWPNAADGASATLNGKRAARDILSVTVKS